MWSNDNGEKLPWQVSTNNGGTLELISSGDSRPHFLAISNEICTPKILACRSDSTRARVAAWDQFINDTNISYFVGVDASEVFPQTLLSGDRNLSTSSSKLLSGLALIMSNAQITWAPGLHAPAGNVGLGDGSATQMSGPSAQSQRAMDTNPVIRIVFP
jgi:hypothetical protein